MNLGQILHEEKIVLQEFHKRASTLSPENKLLELKRLANRIFFRRKNSLRRLRKHFNKNYKNMFNNDCFVYNSPSQHRHHIIPLMNGGINSGKNRISLCFDCHKGIHPWLT